MLHLIQSRVADKEETFPLVAEHLRQQIMGIAVDLHTALDKVKHLRLESPCCLKNRKRRVEWKCVRVCHMVCKYGLKLGGHSGAQATVSYLLRQCQHLYAHVCARNAFILDVLALCMNLSSHHPHFHCNCPIQFHVRVPIPDPPWPSTLPLLSYAIMHRWKSYDCDTLATHR